MTTTTTIKAGDSPQTITLHEGKALTLNGAAGAAGIAYLLDPVLGGTNSTRSWAIGAGALPQIGPFAGTQKILITCTAGSIDATVGDAVLGAATPNNLGDLVAGGAVLPIVGNYSDFYIDAILSGMVLPSTGALANSITAGVAYITGQRRAFVGQSITLTTSSDNYVDAKKDGTYSVIPVAIAAAAPAIAVDSIRLGYITTGASTVTSATATGKDSLGNWMGNRVRARTCILGDANTQGLGAGTDTYVSFASASLEVLDNAIMHSATVNTSRITFNTAGMYRVTGWAGWATGNGAMTLTLAKNRAGRITGMPIDLSGASGKLSAQVTGLAYFNAGDYMELRLNSAGAMSITLAGMSAAQVN
jgi:hypothetical protein